MIKDTDMTNETEIMIESLRLTEPTSNEKLSSDRTLALKHIRSRSPIPRTVLDIVERGVIQP